MRIYVAGPMTGIPEFNYPAFTRAAQQLRANGYEVLNPVDAEKDNPTPGTPRSWEWYMRRAIRMVTRADGIALLAGWEFSRGANREVDIARDLAMPIRPLHEWLTAEQVA